MDQVGARVAVMGMPTSTHVHSHVPELGPISIDIDDH